MTSTLPEKQTALQLTGPDELTLNQDKEVFRPGPYQVLCKTEAVGLCFSDLKLLKQFKDHARKTKILSGIDAKVLEEIPSYAHSDMPTVPGHEAVVRVCAMGDKVEGVALNGRYLVQTDYRWLPTINSNASFGYNFEGALQEYVLMDQRVITSPEGESMLIPASEELSASAIALVEPWACVEHAYAINERQTLKAVGQMLVVADEAIDKSCLASFLNAFASGPPKKLTFLMAVPLNQSEKVSAIQSLDEAEDASYDDVIYYGSNPETAEALFAKVAPKGLYNIVQCGKKFGRDIITQVGRVHYGGIRLIGTTGNDPAEAMPTIPARPEIRQGDKINVVGAAGPMGVMNVIRNICQGVKGVTVYAGDLDEQRLAKLTRLAQPFAEKNQVGYVPYVAGRNQPGEAFDYVVLMAPVPKLVELAVIEAAPKGIVNIFAGIPASVTSPIDLDAYIEKGLYFVGTSGSTMDDMRVVLQKVESGQLDTNMSIAAVCGINHAAEGIRAVENQLLPGKIIVYPECKDLPLTPLEELGEHYPEVAEKLENGIWNRQAEDQLSDTQT